MELDQQNAEKNFYLALKVCAKNKIDKLFLDAALDNPASWKTMESFGGERIKEYYNEEEKETIVDYNVDVQKAIKDNKEKYEPYVSTQNES